jgi:hypothetical protein
MKIETLAASIEAEAHETAGPPPGVPGKEKP